MPELQRVRADHEGPILDFERANRAFFTTSISDRGDEYFENFAQRHQELLARQLAGEGAFYVLVAEDGSVIGRFNLVFPEDGVAEVGYRVAQRVAGRGVAKAAVRELCRVAASRHGVRTLRAASSSANLASQHLLLNAGFTPVGPADPSDLGGKQGSWYQRDVAPQSTRDEVSG